MSEMSRRGFLQTGLGAGVGLAAGIAFPSLLTAQTKAPIKVGVLHSLSGTMAICETSLRDVVLMAVEEINAAAACWGKAQIEPVVVDPASDWPLFAEKAKQLIIAGQGRRRLRLLDVGQPQESVLPVFERDTTPCCSTPCSTKAKSSR